MLDDDIFYHLKGQKMMFQRVWHISTIAIAIAITIAIAINPTFVDKSEGVLYKLVNVTRTDTENGSNGTLTAQNKRPAKISNHGRVYPS